MARWFILPAVILAGWILSWWGSRWIRWGALSTATAVSVGCLFIAVRPEPPGGPDSHCGVQCMPQATIDWWMTGLISVGCCVALLVLTLVGEIVVEFRRERSS